MSSAISHDDLVAIRRQLADGQALIRETVDRLRQSQEENEILTRRRDELESRNSQLETEYEELLGKNLFCNLLSWSEVDLRDLFQRKPSMMRKLVALTSLNRWRS